MNPRLGLFLALALALAPRLYASCPEPEFKNLPYLSGSMNHSCVTLYFDKEAGRIWGHINRSEARIEIDPENRAIRGSANRSGVALDYSGQPGLLYLTGSANRAPYQLHIDWANGTARGFSNNARLWFDFDPKKGTLEGAGNGSRIQLRLDRSSGELRGAMNRIVTQLKLSGLELSDLIEHFYLFLDYPSASVLDSVEGP
ncbi:MAG: hypothetical protein HY549_03955 [Elusimicrobia bacterium]|nr:hypothetical protein [Elusimicrobiota bacterium]